MCNVYIYEWGSRNGTQAFRNPGYGVGRKEMMMACLSALRLRCTKRNLFVAVVMDDLHSGLQSMEKKQRGNTIN
jgi:hypothetical protein